MKNYIHLRQLLYFSNHNINNINKIFNISIKILFLSPTYSMSMSFIGGIGGPSVMDMVAFRFLDIL